GTRWSLMGTLSIGSCVGIMIGLQSVSEFAGVQHIAEVIPIRLQGSQGGEKRGISPDFVNRTLGYVADVHIPVEDLLQLYGCIALPSGVDTEDPVWLPCKVRLVIHQVSEVDLVHAFSDS